MTPHIVGSDLRFLQKAAKDPAPGNRAGRSKTVGLFAEEKVMSDVEKYIERRKAKKPQFAKNFEAGYRAFEFSVMLRQAREEAGVTQEAIARKLRTKKSAISRIENHAEDIRLSTLEKYANALGRKLRVQLAD
jgi:HTH-type transcriptional regulator / antitoxin HipB